MDTVEALEKLLRDRRSIRGFRPDAIPDATLQSVLEMAQLAPSNCNIQPCTVHIVSGDSAERIRGVLHDQAISGAVPAPDFPLPPPYRGAYRERQVNAAKALFAATGVARDDPTARRNSFLRNFRFFDAPYAAFLFIPDWADVWGAVDSGIYAQSFMLALTAHGLASCAQGALTHYATPVRKLLNVGDDMRLVLGIAFGYEALDHPANATSTHRASIDETVRIHR